MSGSAANQRLQAIYESLDSGNNKQAVKHCNALLAKADYPLVKALKALGLQRCGRFDEALSVARELVSSPVACSHEATLSTVLMVFRRAGLASEATAICERGHEAKPQSEEIAVELLRCHLQAAAYGPAQLLALRLYKASGRASHLSWAVAMALLQADSLAPPTHAAATAACDEAAAAANEAQRQKLLRLATAMMARAEVSTEGELQLRLAAHRRAGASEEALALLDAKGGLLPTAAERGRARASLLEATGRAAEAREAQRELLLLSPGDWGALVGFVRSSLRAGGAEAEAEVRAVLAELGGGGGGGGGGDSGGGSSAAGGAAAGSAGGGRGPLLAAAELEASLLRLAPGLLDTEEAAGGGEAAGETAELSPRPASYDPLLEALRAYWRAYSHKQCAVYDVLPYLRALPAASLSALLQQLEAEVGQPPPPDAPLGERRAWLRRFSALGEWRIGGGAAAAQSVDERRQLAAQFVAAHASAADLAAAMDEREVRPADELPLLAAELQLGAPMVEWCYPSRGSAADLASAALAAATLQAGHAASPHNAQLSVALCVALLCLGAPVRAVKLFRGADIKQVQYESLSHLVLPAALELGCPTREGELPLLLSGLRRWRQDGLRDVAENTLLALRQGHPAQALELVAFERAVRGSWWGVAAAVMERLVALGASDGSADAARSALGEGSPLLDVPLTASQLHAMPDTLDLESLTTRWPSASAPPPPPAGSPSVPEGSCGALAGLTLSPPPPSASTVRTLRCDWLPRRQRLLRFLHLYFGGASSAGSARCLFPPPEEAVLCEAEASLRELCGGGAAGGEGGEEGDEEGEWEVLLSLVSASTLVAKLAAAGTDAAALEARAEAAISDAAAALSRRCSRVGEGMRASGGYSPPAQRRLVHLSQLEAPVAAALRSRWDELLPAGRKAAASAAVRTAAAAAAKAMRAAVEELLVRLAGAPVRSNARQALESDELPLPPPLRDGPRKAVCEAVRESEAALLKASREALRTSATALASG